MYLMNSLKLADLSVKFNSILLGWKNCYARFYKKAMTSLVFCEESATVPTLEGTVRHDPGDAIVSGVPGGFCCKIGIRA
jgi:hypothetical protein